MTNNNGAPVTKNFPELSWPEFDALPRVWKEALWGGMVDYTIHPDQDRNEEIIPQLLKHMKTLEGYSTFRTYGPDHPQAIEPPKPGNKGE